MNNARFTIFLSISVFLHAIVLTCLVLAKSATFVALPPQENVIFMQVVPIGAINNLKPKIEENNLKVSDQDTKKVDNASAQAAPSEENKKPQQEEPVENKKQAEPEIQAPTPQPEQQQPALDEKEPEPKAEEPKPKPVVEEKKPEPIAKEKEVTKPKPKPEPVKPKKIDDDLDLNSLEKDLAKKVQDKNKEKPSSGKLENAKNKSGNTSKDKGKALSDKYDSNSPESITAKALMQRRIEENWGKPPSMRDYENLKVKVHLKLDMNQNVISVAGFEFLNESVPDNVQFVIKESIIRAIKLSEPFDMLSLEYYSSWNDNVLVFSYK